ncbi:uncharacterized protein LOC130967212 [Arachis stenosperma]|uniref:uncharacterized protein LOC130967212 n=1 Tax=Arachis stenosperma TaxID=217475 RepID=UPI0025ABBD36|nr:uncharacterized protein LOC130967212 [Arachis stenosperma]
MSRSQYARDMDKNTRNFHNLASARRRNNRIDSLLINVRFRNGLVKQIDEEEAARLEVMPSPDEIRQAVLDFVQEEGDNYQMEDMGKGMRDYIVYVNVDKWVTSKPFRMKRGLRQGDPLLPFLFVLFVDVLHRMETEIVMNYKRLLRCFELMSELSINFDKSNLISINCEQEWVTNMCVLLGCAEVALPVRYLGTALGAKPRLVETWKPIIDKVEDKLSLWKAKSLNKADKLVLIKSVFNSLPVYYLNLYKMPKSVAERLIGLQRRFLWSKEDGNNGIPLVKWKLV